MQRLSVIKYIIADFFSDSKISNHAFTVRNRHNKYKLKDTVTMKIVTIVGILGHFCMFKIQTAGATYSTVFLLRWKAAFDVSKCAGQQQRQWKAVLEFRDFRQTGLHPLNNKPLTSQTRRREEPSPDIGYTSTEPAKIVKLI